MTSGIQFPQDANGKRSTTAVNKAVWSAAAKAVDASVADGIDSERNWRFKYPEHIMKVGQLGMRSADAAYAVAQAGLDSLYEQMTFEREGKEAATVTAAMQAPVGVTYETGTVEGTGPQSKLLEVPVVDQEPLSGEALVKQLRVWADYGCMEATVADAIDNLNRNPSWTGQAMLKDTYFVLLGATSAMGPMQTLLALGATVVAVNRGGEAKWKKMMAAAQNSPGKLLMPLTPAEGESSGDENDLAKRAGADLLVNAPEVARWLVGLGGNSTTMVICNLIYLDGEAHVRATVGMDAIGAAVMEARPKGKTILSYMGSPATVHAIPEGAHVASERAYSNSKPEGGTRSWWHAPTSLVLGGFKKNANAPVVAEGGADAGHAYFLTDGIATLQGPNYALAKTVQMWRAILAYRSGHIASCNMAPGCRTESVVHNKSAANALEGFMTFRPFLTFDSCIVAPIMAALLLHDVSNPASSARPASLGGPPALANPWLLFADTSFHGGSWRCAYHMESVGKAAYMAGLFKSPPKTGTLPVPPVGYVSQQLGVAVAEADTDAAAVQESEA